MTTCGDLGGRTHAGAPCGRAAPGGERRCVDHDSAADEAKEATKAAFLAAYPAFPFLDHAAKQAGISVPTLWRYRQEDPEFDRRVMELVDDGPDRRYQLVQDSLAVSCIKGTHKGGERMFWLVNESRRRGDGRWRNIQHVEQSTIPVDLSKCTEEELKLLSSGLSPLEVFTRTRGLRAEDGGGDDEAA